MSVSGSRSDPVHVSVAVPRAALSRPLTRFAASSLLVRCSGAQWEDSDARAILVNGHDRATREGGGGSRDCPDDGSGRLGGQEVLFTNLNDARSCCVGVCEDGGEVQIMGHQDPIVFSSPAQDGQVRCPLVADLRPVQDIVPVLGNHGRQVRRQVHVEEWIHGSASGTSCSSARHAAYASASRMSSGSR